MEQNEKISIKAKGINSGYNIKSNGLVDVKIEFDATQLVKLLGILQLAGNEFIAFAKLNGDKVKLGKFNFYSMNIDRDGDTKITLRSAVEDVNLTVVNALYEQQEAIIFAFIMA